MVHRVRIGPIVGLLFQIVVLALLATTVGLGALGWATGVACGLVTCAALTRCMVQMGIGALGPADWVTMTRAALVGGVAALTAESFLAPAPVEVLVAATIVALILDGVDGQVARRTGTASPLGARFDMEVDAFLLLVLSVFVTRSMGAWVLAIGAMRYAFVMASWQLPWLRAQLTPRFWRKVVAAVQGVVLVFATADILPTPLMVGALVAALVLLVESFGRDVGWLWQSRHVSSRAGRVVSRRDDRPRRPMD